MALAGRRRKYGLRRGPAACSKGDLCLNIGVNQPTKCSDPPCEFPRVVETDGSIVVLYLVLPAKDAGDHRPNLPLLRGAASGNEGDDLVMILPSTTFLKKVDRVGVSQCDGGLNGGCRDSVWIALSLREFHRLEGVSGTSEVALG
jgi:hypothetical protein